MGSHAEHVESSIKAKFTSLFAKINESNYVMDNYYSDNLINKLIETRKDNNYICTLSHLLSEPLQNLEKYHTSVQVFLVRLLAFVVHKELFFAKLISHINDTLCNGYSNLGSPTMNPSLSVAYLEVALSLVEHYTSLYWLLDSGKWKDILHTDNNSRTVFVTRQKYKFVSRLVWRLNRLEDEDNLKNVLTFILKPLMEKECCIAESMTNDEEELNSKQFEPMMHMLNSIMSDYKELSRSSLVVNMLLTPFRVVNQTCLLLDRYRKDSLSLPSAKLVFRLVLAKVFQAKPIADNSIYNAEDFNEASAAYFNTVNIFITRRNAMAVLDFCYSCNEIWNATWDKKIPKISTLDGKKVDLQNKMLFLCLVPAVTYITRHLPDNARQMSGCLQDYMMKLINASCEHTAKSARSLSLLILELDTETIVLQSVKRLACLNNSMNNEQANLIFQGLFYVLKQFDPLSEDREEKCPEAMFQEDEENLFVYTYALEAVLLLVKNYDINWQESLEIICLYNVVFNILQKTNLSSKFIVTALNVIAVTVCKFLPPNLSLLMESKPGSAMHDLGRLIYMKMHDLHWEVRDSALELLLVCTEISYVKFPPFQKQIIENELIVVAAAVALNDHEFYVRASALRCLGAACKVSAVWDQLKNKHPDIQESLVNILRNNQEGIVRKEACNVLCEMYLNLKLGPEFRQALYEQMVSSAVSDFHWEVQLAALKFWKLVIHNSLCGQGMLDGTFPPVTFSKETRKIVTLNKAEIQRRLLKILDELAAKGCLTVLSKLLHEDTEVEIMDANLTIALDLLDILKRYEVPECVKRVEGEPATMHEYYSDTKEDEMDHDDVVIKTEEAESDNVIEGIINADDMNLLAHIYERHMKLQNDKPELQPKPMIKLLRYVKPYLFVSHLMSKDFKAVIEHKKQWRSGIRNVESLLDDVLGIYEVGNDVNNLDCY
ncbi:uncharacterized protein LOC125233193 isoform X1 [Leguminivora glycinivorella]|uniref:uncharacterized protein LOC125233193 isoform X1 n=1 Tax=Leguminivora glycinivorella TaxID=1035111 RepID=UPI00200FD66E|nr:uncharacterized protein LOC125233193 isoform X1 [Leguminivora glycinivorella]